MHPTILAEAALLVVHHEVSLCSAADRAKAHCGKGVHTLELAASAAGEQGSQQMLAGGSGMPLKLRSASLQDVPSYQLSSTGARGIESAEGRGDANVLVPLMPQLQ